jgi:hypothetical protein
MGRGHLKREARVAYIEAVPKGRVFLVAIVFRGCWIDGIMIREGYEAAREVEAWLAGSDYFEELSGIALGLEMINVLGAGGVRDVEEWAESKGKTVLPLGARNRHQAQVIIDGVKQAL